MCNHYLSLAGRPVATLLRYRGFFQTANKPQLATDERHNSEKKPALHHPTPKKVIKIYPNHYLSIQQGRVAPAIEVRHNTRPYIA